MKKINKQIILIGILFVASALGSCKEQANESPVGIGSIQIKVQATGAVQALQFNVEPASEARPVLYYLKNLREAGQLSYTSSGSAGMVLVESVNGVAGEGVDGRNWIYAIDGALANRGVATMPIKAGQSIVWCFVTYADRESCGKGASTP